ncbi:hypothetical protein EDP2_3540 [Enterobacter cloacae S611]|uniref:LysR family transcriptional regulator n=1 Tax=Enterobacter cloacae S611 TaxID=1399146 RepID=A0ABP2ZX09_ENTCL|nr:hypothetical protein EDP2_3540 [Enterobacter cloacae S611]
MSELLLLQLFAKTLTLNRAIKTIAATYPSA